MKASKDRGWIEVPLGPTCPHRDIQVFCKACRPRLKILVPGATINPNDTLAMAHLERQQWVDPGNCLMWDVWLGKCERCGAPHYFIQTRADMAKASLKERSEANPLD